MKNLRHFYFRLLLTNGFDAFFLFFLEIALFRRIYVGSVFLLLLLLRQLLVDLLIKHK
jgi:hypothetical protein